MTVPGFQFNIWTILIVGSCVFVCCIPAVGKEQVNSKDIERAADVLAQAFIWEIADVPALCKDLNMTTTELRKEIKAEFYKLATANKKKIFHKYLANNILDDEQQKVFMRFLEEHAKESLSLDFVSSFLVCKMFVTRSNEITTSENGKKYHQREEENRIEIKNFCMNALVSSRTQHKMPTVFQYAKQKMSGDFWDIQSWHNAYPVVLEVKDEKVAWWWVNSSIMLLQDAATTTNQELDTMCLNLSFLYSNKIMSGNDKHSHYYQLQIAQRSQKLLEPLDKSLVKKIENKYCSIDWKSPYSYGLYWCEYGLSKPGNAKGELHKLLRLCITKSCYKGRVNIIENQIEPAWVFRSPNFEMFDAFYEMRTDSFFTEGSEETIAKKLIGPYGYYDSSKQLLLLCFKFDRNVEGEKLYSRLQQMFPDNSSLNNSYSIFMHQLLQDQLSQMNSDSIATEILNNLEHGYTLIASGNVEDGKGLLQYSDLVFMQVSKQDIYKGIDIKTLHEKVFLSVLERMPQEHALQLKTWKQNNVQKESN